MDPAPKYGPFSASRLLLQLLLHTWHNFSSIFISLQFSQDVLLYSEFSLCLWWSTLFVVFSCPEQLNRWPCHSVSQSLTCDLWDIWSELWEDMVWPTYIPNHLPIYLTTYLPTYLPTYLKLMWWMCANIDRGRGCVSACLQIFIDASQRGSPEMKRLCDRVTEAVRIMLISLSFFSSHSFHSAGIFTALLILISPA